MKRATLLMWVGGVLLDRPHQIRMGADALIVEDDLFLRTIDRQCLDQPRHVGDLPGKGVAGAVGTNDDVLAHESPRRPSLRHQCEWPAYIPQPNANGLSPQLREQSYQADAPRRACHRLEWR